MVLALLLVVSIDTRTAANDSIAAFWRAAALRSKVVSVVVSVGFSFCFVEVRSAAWSESPETA